MKKEQALLLMLLFVANAFSQVNLTLSFNAMDSLTSQPIALDSVKIANLTSGSDTIIYGASPSLVLYYTGKDTNPRSSKGLYLSNPAPNPSSGKCQVTLITAEYTEVELNLFTINGLLLHAKQVNMRPHTSRVLEVSAGNMETIILVVRTENALLGKKIVSLGDGQINNGNPSIQLIGEYTLANHQLKSTMGFIFMPGDTLQFSAYASAYHISHIQASPTSSAAYTFSLLSDTLFLCGDSLLDFRDGQKYATIKIGTQCWMAENLNVGTMISGSANQTNNSTLEKNCYNNDPNNCSEYGGLYQWDEAMGYSTTAGTQGICPTGWHLPTDAEWCTLTTYLDPTVDCNIFGSSGTDAGGRMKETGTNHWNSPNAGATNSSGFTALGAGCRSYGGNFLGLRDYAYFWSSSESSSTLGIYRGLFCFYADVYRYDYFKTYGFSVRCLRN